MIRLKEDRNHFTVESMAIKTNVTLPLLTQTYICTHTHMYRHMYTYVYIYVYTHAYVIYIYTYIFELLLLESLHMKLIICFCY